MTLALFPACVPPTVLISSQRRPNDTATIEPAAFVIVQGNTPSHYPVLLREAIIDEARRRRIVTRCTILTGIELDEAETIARATRHARGLVSIVPSGGTRSAETPNLVQVLYDARAFRLPPAPTKKADEAEEKRDGGVPAPTEGGAAKAAPPSLGLPSREMVPIWRARMEISGEGLEQTGLRELGRRLVQRLVHDRVLPGVDDEAPAELEGAPAPSTNAE